MFNTYSLNKQVSRIKLQIFNPQMPSLYRSYVLFISPYLFRIMPLPKIALSALMVPVLTLTTPQILPSASLSYPESPGWSKTQVIHQINENYAALEQEEQISEVLSQVLQKVQSLDNDKDKVSALVNLAGTYTRVGQKEKASELLFQALQSAQSIQVKSPEAAYQVVYVLTHVAENYVALGQKEKASEVLSQLLEATQSIHLKSPKEAFSVIYILFKIADNYTALGQKEQAVDVLSQALEKAQTLEVIDSPYRGKISALSGIAIKYARMGQKEKSFKVLSQALQATQLIKSVNSQVDILNNITRDAQREGQYEQALKVTQTTIKVAQGIDIEQEKAGTIDIDRDYGTIASSYAAAGQYEPALRVAQAIKNAQEKAKTLKEIASSYAAAGQYEPALRVAQAIKDAQEKAKALKEIASSYAAVGQYEPALRVAQVIEDSWYKAKALVDIASYYTKAGQKEKASELLSQALQVAPASALKDDQGNYLWDYIAIGYAEAGQYDQALSVAQSIEDTPHQAIVLIKIVNFYAEAGQYDQALSVAQSIEDGWYKTEALDDIATSYALAGQYDQALKVAQAIEDTGSKASALVKIASYYTKAGQKEKASELLSQALKGEEPIDVLVDIAIEYAAIGQYDKAQNIAKTIQTLTSDSPYGQPMALVLAGIAGYYGASGQKEKAAEILPQARHFEQLGDGNRCASEFIRPMLREIANRYIAIGQYNQAFQASKVIKDDEFEKSILDEIVIRYVERDKSSREMSLASTVGGCGSAGTGGESKAAILARYRFNAIKVGEF